MHIHVHTDSHTTANAKLTRQVEAAVENALGHYRRRITRVTVYISDENSGKHFGKSDMRCVMEVRLAGLQPITVSHRGRFLPQAIAGAADKLQKRLKRHLQRMDSVSMRMSQGRAELRAADELLKHDVEDENQEEFIRVLRPLLGCLGNHAWRELRIMEASGMLYPGEVAFADLLEEVVTRAWDQFADRPSWMSIDLWLTSLLDKVLEERSTPEPPFHATLRGHAHTLLPHIVPQLDEQDWSACLLGENLSIEGGLIDPQEDVSEACLEAEELMLRIHSLLGDLPKAQRHAYVLNVLDAYTPAEIALLQGRPETEVQSDIEEARDQLRTRLHVAEKSNASTASFAAASAEKN